MLEQLFHMETKIFVVIGLIGSEPMYQGKRMPIGILDTKIIVNYHLLLCPNPHRAGYFLGKNVDNKQ